MEDCWTLYVDGSSNQNWSMAGLTLTSLEEVLWAYRTTPRTATGKSPFSMTFGSEAVIPVEIGIPSPRVETFEVEKNTKGLRCNHDLIVKHRERARIRMAAYQQRVAKYYNSRVRSRYYRPGELVLRKAQFNYQERHNKLSPNWDDPYRVRAAVKEGTYKLEDLDGKPIPRS
ncbi:Unknown protein [Striga hermonthica]|uniref:Reverse transcriptase domain-containing protein n=1 Tax=Striga hermonthica TaxID=68872 RepID=A0A9N7MYK1_STRHE|nr:Unknown protein [Striga hermonthica]